MPVSEMKPKTRVAVIDYVRAFAEEHGEADLADEFLRGRGLINLETKGLHIRIAATSEGYFKGQAVDVDSLANAIESRLGGWNFTLDTDQGEYPVKIVTTKVMMSDNPSDQVVTAPPDIFDTDDDDVELKDMPVVNWADDDGEAVGNINDGNPFTE